MAGRITVRQRSMRLKRKISATSRNSDGIAMAPAITLNKMYHCVPEQHQQNGAGVQPAAQTDHAQQQNREQRGGRNRGGDLRDGLRDSRQSRVETDGDARGNGPGRRDDERRHYAQETLRPRFRAWSAKSARVIPFEKQQTLKDAVQNEQQRDDARRARRMPFATVAGPRSSPGGLCAPTKR